MNLYQYIRDIRNRTDDNPYGIDPYHSDDALKTFINNARRKIAIDLFTYEKQQFLFPQLYIDEYSLNNDLLRSRSVVDVYNQIEYPPIAKENAEMTKMYFDTVISYGNFCYINETRRKLTQLAIPDSNKVEPTYNVQTFSRATNTIVVNDSSAGNVNTVAKWNQVKGYAKINNATGSSEYIRVSAVVANTTAQTYTLYVSGWDITNAYKSNLQLNGTTAVTSGAVYLAGTNTKYSTELVAGDIITVSGQTRAVTGVTSDTNANVNAVWITTATGATATVTDLPAYTTGDNVRYATYILNYYGIPDELEYYNQDDSFQHEIQDLIPILASVEAYQRRSMPDMAMRELNEYNSKLQDIKHKIKAEKSNLYNKSLYY